VARRPDGHVNRVNQQIMQLQAEMLQKQMAGFEVHPARCECGHEVFIRNMCYHIGFVPEVVCQKQGGAYIKYPIEFYKCAKCGKEYEPKEWEEAARKAFEEGSKKVITPDDMKPDNNGKE